MDEERYELVPEEEIPEEVPDEEEGGEEERRPSAQELAFRLGAGTRSAAAGIGGGIAAFGKGLAIAPPITPIAGRPFGSPLPVAETPEDPLADIFEVPQPEDNDMYTDDLLSVGEEEEVDDLLEVGDLLEVKQEDIMGRAPAPRFQRTQRPFLPTRGLRGIQ